MNDKYDAFLDLYDKANKSINYKYISGIAALRSILDRFEHKNRITISECLEDFLPKNLYLQIIKYREFQNVSEDCPLVKIVIKEKNYVISTVSGILLENDSFDETKLNNITWTLSAVDLADAILISLVSETILILEGPPGIGKTAISKSILESLGISVERINISPSTNKEDIFKRTIPKIEGNGISSVQEEQSLLKTLLSCEFDIKYYKKGLLIDEINIGKEELLELLIYSYLLPIFNKNKKNNDDNDKKYVSFEGKSYNVGKLCVIGTMNNSRLSSSRTSLSNSFLNLCHFFKLRNYSKNEIKLLIEDKFGKDNVINDKIFNAYKISQEISNNCSDNNENTFREILSLKDLYDKCKEIPIEYLIELIFAKNIPPLKFDEFKKKEALN